MLQLASLTSKIFHMLRKWLIFVDLTNHVAQVNMSIVHIFAQNKRFQVSTQILTVIFCHVSDMLIMICIVTS